MKPFGRINFRFPHPGEKTEQKDFAGFGVGGLEFVFGRGNQGLHVGLGEVFLRTGFFKFNSVEGPGSGRL